MSDKNEIFNYVMNTPDNTNPAILRGMLNDLNEGGSPGYDVETVTTEIIPEQTVTPTGDEEIKTADLTLAEGVDAPPESLTVVLDSVEHTTTATVLGEGTVMYMADDLSFDVVIGRHAPLPTLFAVIEGNLSGSITIEAYNKETTVTVTDEFKEAVAVANSSAVGNFVINITYDDDTDTYMMDKTWAEIAAADEIPVAVIRDSASTFYYPVYGVERTEIGYNVSIIKFENDMLDIVTYKASTPSDYPHYGGLV